MHMTFCVHKTYFLSSFILFSYLLCLPACLSLNSTINFLRSCSWDRGWVILILNSDEIRVCLYVPSWLCTGVWLWEMFFFLIPFPSHSSSYQKKSQQAAQVPEETFILNSSRKGHTTPRNQFWFYICNSRHSFSLYLSFLVQLIHSHMLNNTFTLLKTTERSVA